MRGKGTLLSLEHVFLHSLLQQLIVNQRADNP